MGITNSSSSRRLSAAVADRAALQVRRSWLSVVARREGKDAACGHEWDDRPPCFAVTNEIAFADWRGLTGAGQLARAATARLRSTDDLLPDGCAISMRASQATSGSVALRSDPIVPSLVVRLSHGCFYNQISHLRLTSRKSPSFRCVCGIPPP